MSSWEKTPETEMKRLEQNFLVHSYLYYVLDSPIISDEKYDKLCKDLVALLPFVSPTHPITSQAGAEGSGFYIKTYHPKIISKALLLLYWHLAPEESFELFCKKKGYQIKESKGR